MAASERLPEKAQCLGLPDAKASEPQPNSSFTMSEVCSLAKVEMLITGDLGGSTCLQWGLTSQASLRGAKPVY